MSVEDVEEGREEWSGWKRKRLSWWKRKRFI
jgi:hypothetical protein